MNTKPSTSSPCPNSLVLDRDGGDTVIIVGDKARILADAAATGGQCTVFEAITPPGVGPPLHSHEREDEYFYIIEGTVKFSVNGQIHVGSAGTFLLAPRGSIHTFMNAGPKPSRMLIWVTPAGLEQPFRENAALFKHNPQASPDQIAEIFGRFGVRFHGPPLDVSSA